RLDRGGVMPARSDGAPAVPQLEVKIARIDEYAEPLAEDEHRVARVQRVGEQEESAADRKEPERDRHHHAPGALRGDPLHQKPHGEENLRNVAEDHPPLEFLDEYFVEVGADLAREINEHRSPPKPAARACAGGSATTRRKDREGRSTTGRRSHSSTCRDAAD